MLFAVHVLIGECGRVDVKTLFVVSACENMMRDMHWKLNRPNMDVDLQGRLDSKVIVRRHAPSVKVDLVAKRQGERWGKKYVYKGSELSATEVLFCVILPNGRLLTEVSACGRGRLLAHCHRQRNTRAVSTANMRSPMARDAARGGENHTRHKGLGASSYHYAHRVMRILGRYFVVVLGTL